MAVQYIQTLISFSDLGDEKERYCPISHCWSTDGVVLLGCKKGVLLSLDCDSCRITVLMDCYLSESPSSQENLDVIHEG